jgi:NAD+ synthase
MAILNLEAVAVAITKWIEERAQDAHAETAVFGLSGGVDSALVALLVKRSNKLGALGVLMPCHSSPSSLARANELAAKIGLNTVTVDLAQAHEVIASQVDSGLLKIPNVKDKASEGALRSCLRAPTLDYVAKRVNGIIVGTGNRDEDEVTRYFQKRGDGSVDISPIAKLHKSEVYQLARFLGCTDAILDAVPSADLWGPDAGQTDEGQLGVTYAEIEWAISLNDRYPGIFFSVDGSGWGRLTTEGAMKLTDRQKYVLVTLQKMEVASRHKSEMPPVFDPRQYVTPTGDPFFNRPKNFDV